jgi:hypothetical protein
LNFLSKQQSVIIVESNFKSQIFYIGVIKMADQYFQMINNVANHFTILKLVLVFVARNARIIVTMVLALLWLFCTKTDFLEKSYQIALYVTIIVTTALFCDFSLIKFIGIHFL